MNDEIVKHVEKAQESGSLIERQRTIPPREVDNLDEDRVKAEMVLRGSYTRSILFNITR